MRALLKTPREILHDYLSGSGVRVSLATQISVETSLRSDGQQLYFEGLPVERLRKPASVETRLFVPGRFFRKEDADAAVRAARFIHADAHALASVCRNAPELQRRFGLLAFGTEIVREDRTFILCAATKGYLGPRSIVRGNVPSRDRAVALLPVYGGFDDRYAFLGMRFT